MYQYLKEIMIIETRNGTKWIVPGPSGRGSARNYWRRETVGELEWLAKEKGCGACG